MKKTRFLIGCILALSTVHAQSGAPNVSQVLMYSATSPTVVVPTLNGTSSVTLQRPIVSVYSINVPINLATTADIAALASAPNYSAFRVSSSFTQVASALNQSIATALSVIPLTSNASGVITKKDPATGLLLPQSSTLGPILTERAESIGKGQFFMGLSNQTFHFTRFNGNSLNSQTLLYAGGDPTQVKINATALTTVPASFDVGLDIRLSQDVAFFTYGLTDALDVSLGIPLVHAAVASRTYNATVYAGNGFGNPTCFCVSSLTPGFPTLVQSQVGQASYSKTGLGDILLRAKYSLLRKKNIALAVGADLRLPTGDEENYLGVGAASIKPFVAVSVYTKDLGHGLVLSPHFSAGYQVTGKSSLGGELQGTPLTVSSPLGQVGYLGAPFQTTKDFLPDVFSWGAGVEVAVGQRNTLVADVLGNEIGLVHGMANTTTQTLPSLAFPTGTNGDSTGAASPAKGSITGILSAGKTTVAQYSGAFGYKVKLAGNLIAYFNALIRFDDNGLTAKVAPMFGLSYSFTR